MGTSHTFSFVLPTFDKRILMLYRAWVFSPRAAFYNEFVQVFFPWVYICFTLSASVTVCLYWLAFSSVHCIVFNIRDLELPWEICAVVNVWSTSCIKKDAKQPGGDMDTTLASQPRIIQKWEEIGVVNHAYSSPIGMLIFFLLYYCKSVMAIWKGCIRLNKATVIVMNFVVSYH